MKHLVIFALLIIFLLSFSVAAQTFNAELNSASIVSSNNSQAVGVGSVVLNDAQTNITVTIYFADLSSAQTSAKIYNANGIVFDLPNGNFSQTFAVTPAQAAELKSGAWSFKINSANFPNGEIGGQINLVSSPNSATFPFSNGLLDPTFDADGIVTTAIGSGNTVAQAVAVQSDGKIVVAGFTRNGTNDDFAAVRYNPNGSLDTTFGNGGIVITTIGAGEDEAFALVIQPDGKILLAGHTLSGATTDAAVVRYNSNGSLDTTFANGGIAITPVGSSNDFLRGMALQPDGKIVVTGLAYNNSPTDPTSDVIVLRYNSNGTLDDTFDGNSGTGNGIVITSISSRDDLGYAAAVQPDGKIVIAGFYFNGTQNDTAVLRYNANGVLDTTFNGNGIAPPVVTNAPDEAFAVALQTDGKIVVSGCVNYGAGNDFLIVRYNPNGIPDANFGTNGVTSTPIGSGADLSNGVAIQTDGKIIAVGYTNNGANNDFGIVRRNSDGTLDTTFDGDGKATTPIGISTDSANGVAIQADGKIVVVGRTMTGSTANFAIVRYGYGANAQANDGFFTLDSAIDIRFDNAFRAGTTVSAPVNSLSLPPLPANLNLLMSPRSIQTAAGFSGELVVKFKLPASVDQTNFNAAQILHLENGAWTDRATNAPARDFATRTIYARVSSLGNFAVVSPLSQTAQKAIISGRILSSTGIAAANSLVSLTDSNGQAIYAVSNSSGYYKFLNAVLRETYKIRILPKRGRFAPQILTVNDEAVNVNFKGQ